jgi:hypothetical protein
MTKSLNAECSSCESTYNVEFVEELVSQELPEYCPFCGEVIDELTDAYIDEDDDSDDDKWD